MCCGRQRQGSPLDVRFYLFWIAKLDSVKLEEQTSENTKSRLEAVIITNRAGNSRKRFQSFWLPLYQDGVGTDIEPLGELPEKAPVEVTTDAGAFLAAFLATWTSSYAVIMYHDPFGQNRDSGGRVGEG